MFGAPAAAPGCVYMSMITTPRFPSSRSFFSSSSSSSGRSRFQRSSRDGDLQARLFLTTALLLFAASDLFDDPGFEHDEDL